MCFSFVQPNKIGQSTVTDYNVNIIRMRQKDYQNKFNLLPGTKKYSSKTLQNVCGSMKNH